MRVGAAGLIYLALSVAKRFFSMKKEVIVSAVVFNYLNRPIFDVYLNGTMVGASASLSNSPRGQFAIVAGVSVLNGPQKLTWRIDGPEDTPGNGDTIIARNPLKVTIADLPPGTQTLGIHIYPDYTAELIFSDDLIEQSPRGMRYAKNTKKMENNNKNHRWNGKCKNMIRERSSNNELRACCYAL